MTLIARLVDLQQNFKLFYLFFLPKMMGLTYFYGGFLVGPQVFVYNILNFLFIYQCYLRYDKHVRIKNSKVVQCFDI